MKLELMRVLSGAEIRQIHLASLDILEHCGVMLGDAEVAQRMRDRGLAVDAERLCMRIPQRVVEAALEQVPERFDVYDREGALAFTLGDGACRVAAGHNAVFWVDSDTQATRASTVADVAQFARICETLPEIDMIGIPVMPQDVKNPVATLPTAVRACMENSRKPLFFSTDNPMVNGAIIEMMRAVSPWDVGTRPYGIAQFSPTSPLYWEGPVLRGVVDTIASGVPLAILPEPNAGVSAPYSLAGLLTMNNAEWLSGMVLTQLLAPGARILYASSWTTTDMRGGYALVGSAETSACRIAGAQLARFYGVPSHTTAPNSDNHAHDEQNAWERTLSMFCALGSGNDLIVNCGMFATGMTCSHEQLVMDAEITAASRRVTAGVHVGRDSVGMELIKEIGPRGEGYLTACHTLERLRCDEFLQPRLSVRGPRSIWEAQGGKDSFQLARAQVESMSRGAGAELDDARARRLGEILERFV